MTMENITPAQAEIVTKTVKGQTIEIKKPTYEALEKQVQILAKKNRNRKTNLHNLQSAYDDLTRRYNVMFVKATSEHSRAEMWYDRYLDLYNTQKGIAMDVPAKKWMFWE